MCTSEHIAEQLFYEVGDPYRYVLPDVVVDMTGMQARAGQSQPGARRAERAAGRRRRRTAPLTYRRGWRGTIVSPVVGFDAADKAQRLGDAMFTHIGRVLERDGLGAAEATSADLLGTGGSLGAHADPDVRARTREVLTRMTMDHPTREGAELFMREQALANVGLAQGVAMPLGHSTHPDPADALLPAREGRGVPVGHGRRRARRVRRPGGTARGSRAGATRRRTARPRRCSGATPRSRCSRSPGGAAATRATRRPSPSSPGNRDYLPFIGAALSADSVAAWLAHQFDDAGEHRVDRHYADGPGAFSFLLHGALGGGALESRRLDPMAKTVAQQLLAMPVPVPTAIAREATTTSLRPGV